MLTNLLDNNVTGEILSGVLGAIIAFIASFLLLRFNYKDLFAKTISQDRIVWLKQMREYAENLFHYVRNNNSKEQRDYNGKTYYDYVEPILLRLNLSVDKESDEGKIILLIKGDFKTIKDNLNSGNENDLLCLFRSMLKNEWEKVKCEAKGYEDVSNKNRFGKINFSQCIIKCIVFVGLYAFIGLIIGFYLFSYIDNIAVIIVGWILYGLIAFSILFLKLTPFIFKNKKQKKKELNDLE